eukprot:CAMPEP_0172604740 /NCGR_PEP_ID=MMETSP1068-20121228/24997_1 /TAXON_ID=35684 /ORGANISM="Pseudopedinella elastica, Strain CCMP716" /LENGTH=328 /DNA_ID=CAMNT_0013406911 /DNA_START=46 /DNA_END=1029 /DNA_ORIENTATION=-
MYNSNLGGGWPHDSEERDLLDTFDQFDPDNSEDPSDRSTLGYAKIEERMDESGGPSSMGPSDSRPGTKFGPDGVHGNGGENGEIERGGGNGARKMTHQAAHQAARKKTDNFEGMNFGSRVWANDPLMPQEAAHPPLPQGRGPPPQPQPQPPPPPQEGGNNPGYEDPTRAHAHHRPYGPPGSSGSNSWAYYPDPAAHGWDAAAQPPPHHHHHRAAHPHHGGGLGGYGESRSMPAMGEMEDMAAAAGTPGDSSGKQPTTAQATPLSTGSRRHGRAPAADLETLISRRWATAARQARDTGNRASDPPQQARGPGRAGGPSPRWTTSRAGWG